MEKQRALFKELHLHTPAHKSSGLQNNDRQGQHIASHPVPAQ